MIVCAVGNLWLISRSAVFDKFIRVSCWIALVDQLVGYLILFQFEALLPVLGSVADPEPNFLR